VHGLDAHFDRQIADHHAKHDDDEAWQERVQEEAAYLQNEDPDLDADEAWYLAAERVRREDREDTERYWDGVAQERGMG